MAELAPSDLDSYTSGRLAASNAQTAMWLSSALVAARRFCNWYVCPVQTNVSLTVDGPGGRVLSLPTLNLISVSAVTEVGQSLDVTKLDVSKDKGTIVKYPCGHWTNRDGAITVTITHGFSETEAADWRRGVLQLADLMSLDAYGANPIRDDGKMILKRVDDVQYAWSEKIISTNDQLVALLSSYQILPSP